MNKPTIALIIGLFLGTIAGFVLVNNADETDASVIGGNEYNYQEITSTATTTELKDRFGALAQVTITIPASAGTIEIYDATSSAATSTSFATRVAKFDSASDVAGTYTFDATLNNGLVVDSYDWDGNATVMWR